MAKIIITVPDVVLVGKSHHDVRSVIGEALYEYADRRDPSEAYVASRYPDTPEYAWLDREKKVVDVYRRVELSYGLRDHLGTLNIEAADAEARDRAIMEQWLDDDYDDGDCRSWLCAKLWNKLTTFFRR